MKLIITIFYFGLLIISNSCSSQNKGAKNYIIHSEFKKYFDNCGVNGSIVIFDNNYQQWILSDTVGTTNESLPASTFKIINLLIALETKTIKDENEVVKWAGTTDTVKYGYRPEIYRDMTVKEAFSFSAGWVFIELAKKIGKKNYKKYLTACKYGNLNLSENKDDFWNFGNFAISPINQAEFIKNLFEGKLPFSKRNIEIVKRVMITEETEEYTIRAKTGWTRDKGINTGWWVGYLESNNNTYFFATCLLQDRKNKRDDFGTCRKEITKKIFADLGFINHSYKPLNENKSVYNSIDHIPIAVNDIEQIKNIFKNKLHFTVKEGKSHEGINNCFVKFQDGAYLEFVSSIDSLQTVGKYYSDFLKTRQGGTLLAISITNTELLLDRLDKQGVQFISDSNKIWKTIEPENLDLFFIEYADKNWKDNAKFSTHLNTATSLSATYILTDNLIAEKNKYKALGFAETDNGIFLETPYTYFTVGQNGLYLLDGTKSKKLNQFFNSNNLQGVCGFKIKVNSLEMLNKQTKQIGNIKYDESSTTIYLPDYNLFLTFTE